MAKLADFLNELRSKDKFETSVQAAVETVDEVEVLLSGNGVSAQQASPRELEVRDYGDQQEEEIL